MKVESVFDKHSRFVRFINPSRRASFRPSVRSSFRQHLPWVSCERNSSYSFLPIILKLCVCFCHGMKMCMWFGYNCQIIFCHFFHIVNSHFSPQYIGSGYLLWAQLLLQFYTDCFETLHVFSSWYEDVHVVWVKLLEHFGHFFHIVNFIIFHPQYVDNGYLLWAQLL